MTELAAADLSNVQAGDMLAEITYTGSFLRLTKCARRTPKLIWLGLHKHASRYTLDGLSETKRYRIRIPTPDDMQAHEKKVSEKRKRDKEEQRLAELRKTPEYATAKNVGWTLLEAPFCEGEQQYLAFAKRIGLERLKQIEQWIEQAKPKGKK